MRVYSERLLPTQNTETGVNLTGTGRIYATNADHHDFNRTTDGEFFRFRKSTTQVGHLGVALKGGTRGLYLGSYNTGIYFREQDTAITPSDPNSGGTDRDNAVTLGHSAARFKDLYLSGGAYLGGTGSANYLNDYEEGTWTPTVESGITSPVYTVQRGSYIKIGSLVWVSIDIEV